MPKYICMLAYPYDPKRVIFPAFIQPKLDGVRAIWKHKERKFFSRRNKLLAVPQHIIDSVIDSPFDLDGELLIKGLPLNRISGAVRLQDVFNERKKDIFYTIFDIITATAYSERMLACFDFCKLLPVRKAVITITVDTFEQINSLHNINLLSGYEGSIIRNNTPYEFKRSFNLLKIKPRKKIICKLIGMLEGTGKYEGILGALTVKTSQDKIFNVGTGFTDEERQDIWNIPPERYDNIFIVVDFKDYSEFGIPIEASFKGFRQ